VAEVVEQTLGYLMGKMERVVVVLRILVQLLVLVALDTMVAFLDTTTPIAVAVVVEWVE
jgi:hypothetical protein